MTTSLADRLLEIVQSDEAEKNLQDYFREADGINGSVMSYSGRHFERIGGGGDQPRVADRFTAEDILAVEMLSVTVPAEVSYQLLHGLLGRQLSTYLKAIPTDIRLGDQAARPHLEDGSAASEAWSLLEAQHKVGWVTAGKLMARKRPWLIPVYDDVVACTLGRPAHFWLSLDEALAEDQADLRTALADLRRAVNVAATVSDLRVLDVITWMSHQKAHRIGDCTTPTGK